MEKNSKVKKWVNILLFIVTLGILLYFCISNNNLFTLVNILPRVNYFWFLIAVLSMFLSWYFDSIVVYLIMRSIGYKDYSRKCSFRITMMGQYFSAITPLGVGGQPMQVVEMNSQGLTVGKSISVLVRKFLVYQTTMTVYSLVVIVLKSGMFSSSVPGFIPLSLIGFGSQCFIVLVLVMFYVNKKFTTKLIRYLTFLLSKIKLIKDARKFSKSIEDQLEFFVKNNNEMRGNPKLNFILYFTTFLQLTCLFSVPFFVYKSFNIEGFPFFDMISTQAFVTMISSYTPLPGAAGTTEGSFLLLFGVFFGEEAITSAMLLCRFITYYFNIIFGFLFLKIFYRKKKVYKASSK